MARSRVNIFRNGKVHVQKRRCDTCIFRPGNLMHLQAGTVEMMVAESVKDDASIPCHETLEKFRLPWVFRRAQNNGASDCGTVEDGGVDLIGNTEAIRNVTITESMDLQPTIRTLQLELDRVKKVIAQLEQLQNAHGNGSGDSHHRSKRGRKSMESEERRQVSERMKKYWASRRKAR
jgi:hypothetical protein